jgi:hypothetical protein
VLRKNGKSCDFSFVFRTVICNILPTTFITSPPFNRSARSEVASSHASGDKLCSGGVRRAGLKFACNAYCYSIELAAMYP